MRQLLVHPWLYLSGSGGPAHGVGEMRFDLAHAFVAVLQHAFVPLGVEHAGAGFECHLLCECAHHAITLRLVTDIHRRCTGTIAIALVFGLQYSAADATQCVEIGIDAGDTKFYGIYVLVGEADIG